MLVDYMRDFSESNGERELGLWLWFLKPFVRVFHFYLQDILFTRRHE